MSRVSLTCKDCGDCADWNIIREPNGVQLLQCNTCKKEIKIDKLQIDYAQLGVEPV